MQKFIILFRVQRPRYGDPKLTAENWRGVLVPSDQRQKLDGAVHIRSWRSPNGPTFFFKGRNPIVSTPSFTSIVRVCSPFEKSFGF